MARPLGLPEAGELVLAGVAQALEHVAHLAQLALQAGAGLVVGARVELLVDLALQLRGALRGVVAEGLGHKLDVERRLHEGLEGVARAPPEGLEELDRRLLQEEGQHLKGEGGRRGRDLRVDEDQAEEGLVDVRLGRLGALAMARGPVGSRDAGLDDVAKAFDRLLGVGLEEPLVDLAENFTDLLGLLHQLDKEGVFKLQVETRHDLRAE